MKKNTVISRFLFCILMLIPLVLSACGAPAEKSEAEVIEETELYKITRSDLIYEYCLFDLDHNIVKIEGSLSKAPHISVNDENIVTVTYQAGTGIGTQWGYFYDAESNAFSQVFHSIFDQYGRSFVYADKEKLVVRNMFDIEVFYREFTEFDHSFSDVAEPFTEVSFTDNGQQLKVSYYTGDDYSEATQIFDLYPAE